MTVAEFNELVASEGASASSVVLTFDVSGVNVDDYVGSKGWLAELADGTCAALAVASLKVYGTSTAPDPVHPAGTVKLEHGSACCPAPPCTEHWAEPNPGPVIFTAPTQLCSIKVIVNTAHVGYEITCDGTTYLGDSENTDQLAVTKIALLSEATGGHAMTNASAANDQVCFELAPPPANSQRVTAIEDVTVSPSSPDQVYAPDTDLVCGATDGSIYLKFPLTNPLGKVQSAKVFLRSASDSSATGDGGDLFFVNDNGWSELTLTYSAAPSPQQPAVGRIQGVIPDQWYDVDVTSSVTTQGTYSFALIPRSTDQNGAHFLSKEASSTLAPYMVVEYTVVDSDGDSFPDGPDCDDSNAAVHPGATEACDGVDNDCNGVVDDGCAGGEDAAADSPWGVISDGGTLDGAPGGGPQLNPVDDSARLEDSGCACSTPRLSGSAGAGGGLAAACLLLWRLRRRRGSVPDR